MSQYIAFPSNYPPERARERIRECVELLSEPGRVPNIEDRARYWISAKSAFNVVKASEADSTPCDSEPRSA